MLTADEWYVEVKTLDKIEDGKDGYFYVTTDGMTCGIKNVNSHPLPAAGDVATFYYESPGGWGGRTTGFYCNGLEYFYMTKKQFEAEREAWIEEYDRKKQQAYDDHYGEWVKRKNNLIQPLRLRLQRFEIKEGFEEFWRQDGGYELFVLEQAELLYFYAMSQSSDPVKWIDEWRDLPYDEQMKVTGLSDGHSGNTFGGMVGIARALLEGREV